MLQSNSFITCYCNLSAADVRLVIVVCSVAGGRILRACLTNVKPNMASKQLIYWLLLKVIFCVTGWIFLLLDLEIISSITGKTNRFPKLDILGYLKNTHKNHKFGRVRQVPTRELGWEFPGWDLSHFANVLDFCGYSSKTLKYPILGIC